MNSPTIAPTSANGTLTFIAVMIHGEAAGSTTLKKVCRSLAPITRAIEMKAAIDASQS